ncbi:unnamed protein product [Cylindrotheca closterium]|uniref:Uncharacterized protein n=1 Tax=Cylindrotheca closterium TaxID=2856 RepID=A0AAD2FG33_9STRA|nr:unnamed protein product [Cylindrotheca closterium]
MRSQQVLLLCLHLTASGVNSFTSQESVAIKNRTPLYGKTNDQEVSSYSDTDAASKGFVSALTNVFNAAAGPSEDNSIRKQKASPKNVEELQSRIRDDYEINNYLWTGKLDLDCFTDSCRFTDPTLTFQGTDKFKQNTDSLIPLVERFVENYQSILLDIRRTDEYIETRWNMVGELNGLFWKPEINVIGRTKFWFNPKDYLVYFYDESWEVPAFQALLQLVTPAKTFPNSSAPKEETKEQ